MLEFIKTLLGTFGSLFTFFWNFISKLPSFILFLTNSIALLPMILIPFITAAISIYVVLFIVGRN